MQIQIGGYGKHVLRRQALKDTPLGPLAPKPSIMSIDGAEPSPPAKQSEFLETVDPETGYVFYVPRALLKHAKQAKETAKKTSPRALPFQEVEKPRLGLDDLQSAARKNRDPRLTPRNGTTKNTPGRESTTSSGNNTPRSNVAELTPKTAGVCRTLRDFGVADPGNKETTDETVTEQDGDGTSSTIKENITLTEKEANALLEDEEKNQETEKKPAN